MIKNALDFIKEKFSLIVAFCFIFVLYSIILEKAKIMIEKHVLVHIIGIEVSEYLPIATTIFLIILSLIFSVITLFLISFAKRPQNDNYICLVLKSNEVFADYKDYLNYIPTEKTSSYPDFTIASFNKKLLGVFYIIFCFIPVLDKNYFVTCILASIPFLYNIFKNLADKKKKDVDIHLKITLLVIFLGIFTFSSYYVIFDIVDGNFNINTASNLVYKTHSTLSHLGINLMEEEIYKAAIMLDRKNIDVYLSLSAYYNKLGKKDLTIKTFQDMILRAPESPYGYYYLGLEKKNNKKPSEALELFHKARFLDSNFSKAYYEEALYYYSMGNIDKAEKIIDMVDISITDYDVRLFELKKDILIKKRNYEEALEVFYYAIEKDSITHAFYYEKANVYYNVGSFPGALKNIDKAISINPTEKKYYNFRGKILLSLNSPQSAINSFKKAISIDASYQSALVGIELAYLMLGKIKFAYSNILKLQEKYTEFDSQSLFAMSQISKEAGYLDIALQLIDKALLKSPNDPSLMAFKSLLLMEAGNYENAFNLVKKSLEIEGKNYLAHFAMGNYFLYKGDYKKSIDGFSKASQYNPYFARSFVCIALANYKLNRAFGVDNYIDYAKLLNPNDYFVYLIHSTILEVKGMESLASIERQMAIKKQN